MPPLIQVAPPPEKKERKQVSSRMGDNTCFLNIFEPITSGFALGILAQNLGLSTS